MSGRNGAAEEDVEYQDEGLAESSETFEQAGERCYVQTRIQCFAKRLSTRSLKDEFASSKSHPDADTGRHKDAACNFTSSS